MEFCVQIFPEFDIRPVYEEICAYLAHLDQQMNQEVNTHSIQAQDELKARWGTLSILELKELKEAATPEEIEPVEDRYRDQVQTLLKQYEELGPKPNIIRLGRGVQREELSEEDQRRVALIRNFINVSQEFVPIRIYQRNCNVPYCSGCGKIFDQNGGESVGVCPNCGLFQRVTYQRTVRDMEDALVVTEEYSQDLTNYIDTAKAYQGLTRPTFPPNFREEINSFLRKMQYPTTEDVRANPKRYPLQKDLTRKGTPRNIMYAAIRACCRQPSRYYKYINVICHEIWDWGLPRFESLMQTLIQEYQISQPVYRRIVAGKKNSSLNAQLRLFVDLWRHQDRLNFELRQTNFKIPDTPSIREENAQAWNATCRELHWVSPFIAKSQEVTLGRRIGKKRNSAN